MTKLFISYRSLDSAKVDSLVSRLRNVKTESDTPLYEVWQDKFGILPGQDWWQAIVDAIIDCDVFVFMVSRESVGNINCQAELSYARRRNRPIVAVILEGEFFYNGVTGKNDLDYFDDVPQELKDSRTQFLFYEGTSFLPQLAVAIEQFQAEPQKWRDMDADRPPDPRHASEANNSTVALYDQGYEYAIGQDYEAAQVWFQKLVNMNDPDFAEDAFAWINLLREYQKILRYAARPSTWHRARTAWDSYRHQFPLPFIDMFDPDKVADRIHNEAPPEAPAATPALEPAPEAPPQTPPAADKDVTWMTADADHYGEAAYMDTASSLADFAWIEIPASTRLDLRNSFRLEPAYAISKYPITNAQFVQFIDSEGYDNPEWWTDAGWQFIQTVTFKNPAPRNMMMADGEEHKPVTGLSWYEAVAFCRWFGNIQGENILLPTHHQWRHAAQSADSRKYPWGNTWDCGRCNNRVPPCQSDGLTPVHEYEGQGDSLFGVVDMLGNAQEWCLTAMKTESDDVDGDHIRVLRGGGYALDTAQAYELSNWTSAEPSTRDTMIGFRIVRNYD